MGFGVVTVKIYNLVQILFMQNRRRFLRMSALGAAGIVASGKINVQAAEAPEPREKGTVPVVVSTWNFGKEANAAAWKVLAADGHSLDAVEQGVWVPEADPTNQSVGLGGRPDRDGHVTLDACIMDDQYRCGSVACLEHIVHPISVARKVMEKTQHVMLVGEGALQFALENGFKKENLLTEKSKKEWEDWLKTSKYEPVMNIENKGTKPFPGDERNHDTIGMLAIDSKGRVSGACTTSGMAFKLRGRVGDSPIIGAGLFVDNEIGAATSTGVGEEVIRCVGSHLVVELMRHGHSPTEACKKAVERLVKFNPEKAKNIQVGFLAVNKAGVVGAWALQKGFTYSVRTNDTDTVFDAGYFYENVK